MSSGLLLPLRVAALVLTVWLASSPAVLHAAAWQSGSGYRWMPLKISGVPEPGFERMAAERTGIHFTNEVSEPAGAANRVLYNGAGVAAGDFDNDGLPDLFFCNLAGRNALYRNLGNWRFEDVTDSAGLGDHLPETRGAVFADIDGDSDLDLLLAINRRGVACFRNDNARFTDITHLTGITGSDGSTTLALADVDGDGSLDLYIANYRPDDIRDRGRVSMTMVNGRPILPGSETNRFILLNGKLEECGQPDQLLLNDGSGKFKPVPWTSFHDASGTPLTEPPLDWGLTVTFRDLNGDLAPDIYVCNDFWTPDRCWINDGHGRFRALPTFGIRKMPASSMSADFADVDRDGAVDGFVVDMLSRDPRLRKRQRPAQTPIASPPGVFDDCPQITRNVLFKNHGDGTFAEIAFASGMAASDWSWSAIFMDVDLDGFEDLLVGAGHFRDVQDYDAEREVQARQHPWTGFRTDAERQKAYTRELLEHYRLYPRLDMPIIGFRNEGGARFAEATLQWGLDHPGIHQGIAIADFDLDGAPDLAVNSLNASASLFRNRTSAGRVAVTLKGRPPNTQGIGAKVTLRGGAVPIQSTEIISGGRYLSGSVPEAVFATGTNTSGMTLEVRWRDGTLSVIEEVKANRRYEIAQSAARPAPNETRKNTAPDTWFDDVSDKLQARHHETDFNDYQRQPLLPFKLSQQGPGIAWFDLDGDGSDELVAGTGRGGVPLIFRQQGGEFRPHPGGATFTATDDTTGLVGWQDPTGARRLLVGVSGYESQSRGTVTELGILRNKISHTNVLFSPTNTGALAIGFPLGENQPVLFVAGDVIPGQYPLGAPSRLYHWSGGRWQPDTRNNVLLENLGIVHAAVWSDLDADGLAELVLACEWGPIRVFQMRRGALTERTREMGLEPHTGWWRGVTTGDLNSDGRMDIVASNWGLNSPYRASPDQPLTFAFGQLAQPGVVEILETEYDGDVLVPRRQLHSLAQSLPFLLAHFSTHKAYSEASLEMVLGDRLPLSRRVHAATLASTAFINTGSGFKPVELPHEAHFAPAFGVIVSDFNGDGHEDVFLSQNFFPVIPEITRIDAGLGLLLRGDGSGGLAPVPPVESGIRIFGEQRGAAAADFDSDGRLDLAVAQNAADVKLYRNRGARPGLRVRLIGPPANPDAIGAMLRLRFENSLGPAREIHAGSGYWSQNSTVQVLGTPSTPKSLMVRWPGGRATETPLPPRVREVTIASTGELTASR